MCGLLQVSRSGYDQDLQTLSRPICQEKKQLLQVTQEIFHQSSQTYGTRRISAAWQAQGYAVGRFEARSLMKQAGLQVKQKKRFRITTQSKHGLPVAPNLLNRQFHVEEPNEVWVSDITYLATQQGGMY